LNVPYAFYVRDEACYGNQEVKEASSPAILDASSKEMLERYAFGLKAYTVVARLWEYVRTLHNYCMRGDKQPCMTPRNTSPLGSTACRCDYKTINAKHIGKT